ncbi:hypothetical protein A6V36_18730 [Paraburkholderia ginsengiterrae]|uniref:Uncharacterized protein n=1 Tax=Paraburkholderia ginsengiterrae TaxID=1462993 RepID=A0A1A9MYX5_9BURK|nr:hypothetical protein [Paraburkholderia ginsengiterrae]OAJ52152.1 hypothetical protein A6V37_10910 [Paraburkholderia ginsengiterrae]OAJ63517.1 hypothetical protein A6V36_18730 [Paraburkholderia ginsengiterrae]
MTTTFGVDLPQPALLYTPTQGVPIRVIEAPTDYITPSIQIATTIFAAAVSVLVIVLQLRRQHREAIEQHKRSVKADLQLEAYREFQSAIRPYSDASVPTATMASIRTAFAIAVDRTQAGLDQAPVIYRAPAFMGELNRYAEAAVRLIFFIERYDALLVGFDIFKIAINSAIHDIHHTNLLFQSMLIRWLPIENPEVARNPAAAPFIYRPDITANTLIEFDALAEPLQVALGRLQCWIGDLAVEVQNHLLGEYADQPVERRNAPNQSYFTVTAAPDERQRLDGLFSAMPFMQQAIAAGNHARQANQRG